MSVDRPKSAEKLLVKFLDKPPEHHDSFKVVYDEPGSHERLAEVTYCSVWNACDHYEEQWFHRDGGPPDGYVLTLTTTSDEYYVRWARALYDRGGLWLPEPGPWRFRGATDGWENTMSLREVTFNTTYQVEKETA